MFNVTLRDGTILTFEEEVIVVDYDHNTVLRIYKKINNTKITLALIPYDIIAYVLFENDE